MKGEKVRKVSDKDFIVAISPESRPDDKFCFCGTRKAVGRAFALDMECSMNARKLDKIPNSKTLFWVTYSKENWAGSGWGASELFANMREVKAWILNHIEEENLNIGKVIFVIYPVYRVSDESVERAEKSQDEFNTVLEKMSKLRPISKKGDKSE